MCVASFLSCSGSTSSGPAHQRTGIPSSRATARKFSIGQRLTALLAKGCRMAKVSTGADGIEILGTALVGSGGDAGKNVKGRSRTASRKPGRAEPYQE